MDRAFGEFNVAPSAMLSGVYSIENIMSAQADGPLIFWSHRVEDLGAFLKFNEVMNEGDVARVARSVDRECQAIPHVTPARPRAQHQILVDSKSSTSSNVHGHRI